MNCSGRLILRPLHLEEDFDDRGWHELSEGEREWITEELFKSFGFNRRNEVVVGKYIFDAPQGEGVTWTGTTSVKVFETLRSKLEDMYLHEITRPGTEREYVIAPKDARL